MNESSLVLYEVQQSVATITLNRPKSLNAMTSGLMKELANAMSRIEADKSVRVAVFAREDKAEEARAAGADLVGADDLAEKIQGGDFDFDRCIATPDMMAVVGRLGKVLGPKGLMPNPKLGTVTPNVSDAVKAAKGGEIEFRVEKAGIIHAGVGKASFSPEALAENVRAFMGAIIKAKPSGAKGTYVKRATISSTMGPGIKLDVTSLGE